MKVSSTGLCSLLLGMNIVVGAVLYKGTACSLTLFPLKNNNVNTLQEHVGKE